MNARKKTAQPIRAAGGIVVRGDPDPLIAIVQLRKDKSWVLPKGKLKRREDALTAAKREVREETGRDVAVHEFLGSMSHAAGGKQKVAQFWRMRAGSAPAHKLMRDVRDVQWLPLEQAIATLTHAHERAFLARVGPAALEAAAYDVPVESLEFAIRTRWIETMQAWFRRVMRK